jgi:hypothetical protein
MNEREEAELQLIVGKRVVEAGGGGRKREGRNSFKIPTGNTETGVKWYLIAQDCRDRSSHVNQSAERRKRQDASDRGRRHQETRLGTRTSGGMQKTLCL